MNYIIKIVLKFLFPKRFIFAKIKNKDRKVALTFDDGPYTANTTELLNILRQEDIKATFFVLGENLEKYPDLSRDIADAGHEIGNHSFSHKKISDLGIERYWQDVQRTSELIARHAKIKTCLFRPPYGEFNLSIFRGILKNSMVLAGWTLDSKDSWLKDKDGLIQYMQTRKVKSGDIILFHEDYGITIEAISQIIKDLKKRGFNLVTVSELQGA